ncbi:MAG: hypothetical protein HQM16_10170 [Deltaproteobacteria bacterium]|nr:hypothetical protein [Deltaproteobacteria bacterium]
MKQQSNKEKLLDDIIDDIKTGSKYVVEVLSECADEIIERGSQALKKLRQKKLPRKEQR